MKLATVVSTSAALKATRSRKKKIAALAECLRALEPHEIELGVGMLAGAPRQGKIGLGHATIHAVQVSASAKAQLHLREVDRTLTEIAETRGSGSAGRRKELLGGMLTRATSDEQTFLRQLLVGGLRQGALEGIVVEAVARAAELEPRMVRRALMLSGELGNVAHAALTKGAHALSEFSLELFRPVQPMLAQPAESVESVIQELGEVNLEWKLDGARIQVHKDGDEVQVFTRRLNVVTPAVPDVVELVRELPARRLILDGEAIALRGDGSPLPFQVTMRRFGRRLDVAKLREELPLTPMFFDVLMLDDHSLIDEGTGRRWEALDEAIPSVARIPRLRTDDLEQAEAFIDDALGRGHEGVMAKSLDVPYEAGRRGSGWRKLKPTHTLDLVVLAAEWGSGRREGWLSNLHLGARDPANGSFVMLGKTFKGLTDKLLTWQTEQFLAREIGRDQWTVHLKPELVVEIAFNDVQASPHYPGGMVLRFARVKRYREDKTADQADTIDQVREIFAASQGASSS
jgi:DNA ligase-1